jgi:hypothetical protein
MTCVVRAANHSGIPYTGWVRSKVDALPPHPVGRVGDVLYVLGQPDGLDTWAIDLRLTIQPGQELAIDLSTAEPAEWEMPPLPSPADLIAHFGGLPMLAGYPMLAVGTEADGACLVTHLMGRARNMLGVHGWVRWCPDQPELAWGEFITVASDPSNAALSETAEFDLPLFTVEAVGLGAVPATLDYGTLPLFEVAATGAGEMPGTAEFSVLGEAGVALSI